MITRRSFVHGSAATLASTVVARSVVGMPLERFQELPEPRDQRLQQLIETSVGAAMSSGAKYADARLTFTQNLKIKASWSERDKVLDNNAIPNRSEIMSFGVRALFDGYWGFAASPVWGMTEAARLGRSAVESAKANVLGKPRQVDLGPKPTLQHGDWTMAVKDDPFNMAFEEIYDYFRGFAGYLQRLPFNSGSLMSGEFMRQQKCFGSSDGQFVTQRLYRSGGTIRLSIRDGEQRSAHGAVEGLTMAGLGFEYFRDQPLRAMVDAVHDEALRDRLLPVVPAEVGRYPVLIDPTGLASIVGQSVGAATEIDRVMGYEANAGGTSYITDPDAMLETLKIGAPSLQISGGRSKPGTLAQVRWDDEGVEPRDFPIVKDGLLVNLQTNREGCGWISPRNDTGNQRVPSFGCAYTPDAIDVPLVHSANLTVHPDATARYTLDTLRQDLDRGVEWKMPAAGMDFQQSTGLLAEGTAYEIKNGKRISRMIGAGMLFRTSELWCNLLRLGGENSVVHVGQHQWKGEPWREAYFSVDTPPGVFKDMAVINSLQKA